MAASNIRKGMPPVKLSRVEFEKRYRGRFADPVFAPLADDVAAITRGVEMSSHLMPEVSAQPLSATPTAAFVCC